MNIKRIYISIFCFLMVFPAWSQQANPFEIKERLKDSTQTESNLQPEKSNSEGVAENPLEIKDQKTSDQAMGGQMMPDSEELTTNPFEIDRASPKDDNANKEVVSQVKESEKTETGTLKNTVSNEVQRDDSIATGNFLFWIILLAFLILAVGLSLDRWFITKLFKGILNYNLSNTMMRESTGFKSILMAIMYLLFLISLSVFIFLIQQNYTGNGSTLYLLYCFIFVTLVYAIRHVALHLFYFVFPTLPEALAYSYSIVTFNIVSGILLLVPMLLMAYSSNLIFSIAMVFGFVVIGILYLLRSFRGLLIAFKYINDNPIHFFLYLCAFEIVPLMVVYKFVTDFV